MLRKTLRFTNQVRACCLGICAFVCMGAVAAGCSSDNEDGTELPGPSTAAGSGAGNSGSGGKGGSQASSNAGMQAVGRAGRGAQSGSGSTPTGGDVTTGGSGGGWMGADGASASGSGGAAGDMVVEAKCGADDKPEKGIQGDVNSGTVNCGLTLLADVPGGGSVQGSGHCAYVRTGGAIKAYSLADPLKPMMTDQEPTIGSSESMRAQTVSDRAVLVSGSGVNTTRRPAN